MREPQFISVCVRDTKIKKQDLMFLQRHLHTDRWKGTHCVQSINGVTEDILYEFTVIKLTISVKRRQDSSPELSCLSLVFGMPKTQMHYWFQLTWDIEIHICLQHLVCIHCEWAVSSPAPPVHISNIPSEQSEPSAGSGLVLALI